MQISPVVRIDRIASWRTPHASLDSLFLRDYYCPQFSHADAHPRRTMRSTLITALAVVVIGFECQTAEGQINGREPACGCYCSYPYYESFDITPCTGRLSDDACEDNMKQMPPDQFRKVCRWMQAKLRSKPDTYPCKKLFNQICPPHCEDIGCHCGYSPDGGCTFAYSGSGTGSIRIFEMPSSASAPLAAIPNGTRVCYKMVMKVDGQEWFQVRPPGKPAGWVSSKDLKCRRPGEPLPIFPPGRPDPGAARPTAAQVAGGRG